LASLPIRRDDSRASTARGFAALATIGILICLWIVAVWTSWGGGPLHENVKVKIFWTVISVVLLGIVVAASVERWRRK